MTSEYHVDGNAMGGMLMEIFGLEMTDARGCCDGCGAVHAIGAMLVYRSASDVMRCPGCGDVLIVVVTIAERARLHVGGLRWLEPGSET